MDEKGLDSRALFSSFPRPCGRSWTWHLVVTERAATGCRDFIGPVPQSLWMSAHLAVNGLTFALAALKMQMIYLPGQTAMGALIAGCGS